MSHLDKQPMNMPNPNKAHLTINHLFSDFHVLVEGGYITSLAI